jgi:hypothetical protein
MERLRPQMARSAEDVPASPGELTSEWLTAILCSRTPDARVESFTTPSGSAGTSTRVALRVNYNAAGRDAGLPTELFAKLATTYQQRLLLGGAGVLPGETIFFTQLRPQIDMEAPQGYGGKTDERAWKSAVVMEDIAATKSAEFIEPIHPQSPITMRSARSDCRDSTCRLLLVSSCIVVSISALSDEQQIDVQLDIPADCVAAAR